MVGVDRAIRDDAGRSLGTDQCCRLISHDGQRIMSGGEDEILRLWSVSTGKLLGVVGDCEHETSASSVQHTTASSVSSACLNTLQSMRYRVARVVWKIVKLGMLRVGWKRSWHPLPTRTIFRTVRPAYSDGSLQTSLESLVRVRRFRFGDLGLIIMPSRLSVAVHDGQSGKLVVGCTNGRSLILRFWYRSVNLDGKFLGTGKQHAWRWF